MDIRDIKEVVKSDNMGFLQEIFCLQLQLLEKYKVIEGLPDYPVDLNTKPSQLLIKDFVGRFIEELAEAWESYNLASEAYLNGYPSRVITNHVINANEEMSDALHFFLELLVYSGVNESVLLESFNQDKTMGTALILPDSMVDELMISGILSSPENSHNELLLGLDENFSIDMQMGFRNYHPKYRNALEVKFWKLVYKVSILRNTLKNKPWKQTQVMTDEKTYSKILCKSFEELMELLGLLGHNLRSMYGIYYRKNKINQFRINSKY